MAETRTVIVSNNNDYGVPQANYSFVEAYCNEKKCDCRRVFFNVFSSESNEIKAVICWGWESKDFYIKWLGINDKEMILELMGPALNVGSPQSKIAPQLVEMCKELLLSNKNYIDRIKRHYQLFKKSI